MQLHQYRTDGAIDRTELNAFTLEQAKRRAIISVANPAESGVYRVKFVDVEYERDVFDTYHLSERELLVGTLVYAGAA